MTATRVSVETVRSCPTLGLRHRWCGGVEYEKKRPGDIVVPDFEMVDKKREHGSGDEGREELAQPEEVEWEWRIVGGLLGDAGAGAGCCVAIHGGQDLR